MVFSSLVFMFAYLPITLLAYYLVPRQGRNIFLFIVNLIFYGWGEPKLVLLMVFNIFFNYIGGWLVDKYRADAKKKKLFLILTCVLDIGILAVFKYTGMITETLNMLPFLNIPELQISLPIGISFYTFQTMSYVIDVYRDDAPVSKNFINFGTYVALFPQLIAGPIVRYRDVAEQLVNRRETLEMFTRGVKLFMVGLAKKVIIANTMGTLTTNIFATTDENGVVGTWVGMIAYTFQIYFDFSGYSDMACGLGNMMGFEFLKNFNYPYIAKSITDFWRRWHISLGAWLKEYVFYPVSLSGHFKKVNTFTKKHIKSQHIVGFITIAYTLFFVWFCNGLWHGASWLYIVYGLYYYVLMMLGKFTEPYTDKLAKKLHINKESKGYSVFQVARTVVIVNVGMLLFRSSTLVEFGKLFGKMFTSINFMDFCSIIKIKDGIILAIGFVVMLLVGIIKEKGIDIRMWLIEHNFVIRWLVYYFLLFSTIILGAYGVGYGGAAAIYAQF